MKPFLFAVAVLSVSLSSSVQARDWDDNAWVRQTIRQERREQYRRAYNHYRPPVYSYQRRYEPPAPVYVEHRHEHEWNKSLPGDRGVECHIREDVVGDIANTEAGALSKAERHWQSMARYKHGERYLDLTNARGYRKRCDRASTNETVVGKLTEAIAGDGGVQYRCFVSAQPCKANLDQGRSGR